MTTDEMTKFVPEHLRRWRLPSCYVGAEWPEYFVFLGQSRDSDALERSNFTCGLKEIGGEKAAEDDGPDPVIVVRESHWAVGWVEWIGIHESNEAALRIADDIKAGLEDYPVVDEGHWSELEQEDAHLTWKNCFNQAERVAYIRKHRNQFEFRGLRDAIGCVRGDYFAGWAGELLY